MGKTSKIHYFEDEGHQHLLQTIKQVKAYLKVQSSQAQVYPKHIIFFTRQGEGPALAYNELQEYDPAIIAVTFPPRFTIKRGDERVTVQIPDKIRKFFVDVGIEIISARLPFDEVSGIRETTKNIAMMQQCFGVFGSGMPLAIQSVLQACDYGFIEIGEEVIAITGDTALVVTASTTDLFLSKDQGLAINEIICKPRKLTMGRSHIAGHLSAESSAVAVSEKNSNRMLSFPSSE